MQKFTVLIYYLVGTQISQVCQKPLFNSVRSSTELNLGQENKEEVPPSKFFDSLDPFLKGAGIITDAVRTPC